MIQKNGNVAIERLKPMSGHSKAILSIFKFFFSLGLIALLCACAVDFPEPMMPEYAAELTDNAYVTGDGSSLPIRRYGSENPNAVVIAVHGFNDYSNSFDGFGKYLAGRGMGLIAYDQRGFGAAPNVGRWAGHRTMTVDLRVLAGLVRARYPKTPIYILGDSMGGAITILASTQNPPMAIDGIILIAPAIWGRSTMNPIQVAALWMGAHTMPWLNLSGDGLGLKPSDNIPMLKALAADPLVQKSARIDKLYGMTDLMDEALDQSAQIDEKCLIVYGAHDDIIPKSAMREMIDRLPDNDGWQFLLVADGYHMILRDLGAPRIWADIANWIAGDTKSLQNSIFTQRNKADIPLF